MLKSDRVRGQRIRVTAALLLLATCLGASAQAAPQAARKVPSGAELLAGDARYLGPAYAPCMAAATTVDARRRCVDSELKIHDDALNAAYSAALSALPVGDQRVLRVLQRQWIGQRDSRCPLAGDAAAQLDAQQCRTHMTLLRARQLQGGGAAALVAEANAARAPAQAASHTADGAPDAQGRITLQPGPGDISPALQVVFKVADCSGTDNVTTCQVQAMEVTRGGRKVMVTGVQPRLTRAGADARGSASVLLTVADFNGDGMPDLQVWQDNTGVYNVPVHAFYLFDAKRNRYVRATALEAAIGGRDIDHIDHGRFVLRARVSPCEREDKVIQLRGTQPRTVLARRYDTCRGERPTESDLLE
ncbi:lysozyme inhibitor LprI family protein [Stenotrophomonas tuberculopleuritidis]|uniref:lysozyme inhibitor LprI family protein n=1 Tax=Stenotrophomonas tuberculopleuritidis TaxID=3055079 RepID=UPI0026E5307C|nr:lysozyme inhibitor LprI family protein [Stenotrophomonas sp. 704A1]